MSWRIDQVIHNSNTSGYLALVNPTYVDWEITCIYYAAVQLVDEYIFRTGNRQPQDHGQRKRLVRSLIPNAYSDYWNLEQLSRHTRYDHKYDRFGTQEKADALRWYSNVSTIINSVMPP